MMSNLPHLNDLLKTVGSLKEDYLRAKSEYSEQFQQNFLGQISNLEKTLVQEMSHTVGINLSSFEPSFENSPKEVPLNEEIPTVATEPHLPHPELILPAEALFSEDEGSKSLPEDDLIDELFSETASTSPAYSEPTNSQVEFKEPEETTPIPTVESSVTEEIAPEQQEVSAVEKIGPTEWKIRKNSIICLVRDVIVRRGANEFAIKFRISPLLKTVNGPVPILVNAEYRGFDMKQNTTAMSEDGEFLLQMEVDVYSFLIKGSFTNGVFDASVISAGRSVNEGDQIESRDVKLLGGTEAVPCIELQPDNKLWLSCDERDEAYFGIAHCGEWIDPYDRNHDLMIQMADTGDYEELRLTRAEDGWSLKL